MPLSHRLAIFCTLFVILCCPPVLSAQRVTREIPNNWWFGSHVNLGFSASTFQSLFSFGLSPMAGYKVLPFLSAGPRAKAIMNHFRVRDFATEVLKGTAVDYGVGGFVRASVYRGYFAQGDLLYENNATPFLSNDIYFERYKGMNAYIGVGYNAGNSGGGSFDIMLAYDLNLLGVPTTNLIDYRFGFTFYY